MTEPLDITRKLELLGAGHLLGYQEVCAEALAEIYQLRGKLMTADAKLLESNVPSDWVRRSGYAVASLPIDNFRVHVQTPQTVEWSAAQDPTSFDPTNECVFPNCGNLGRACNRNCSNPGLANNWRDVVHAATVECDTLPADKPETPPEPWGSPFAMDTRNWK